jgi:hypothetical protein
MGGRDVRKEAMSPVLYPPVYTLRLELPVWGRGTPITKIDIIPALPLH